MQIREYQIRLDSPAFLGNAEQKGQWRAPPFKALLRYWWRVAWAARNGAEAWQQMRQVESHLFGYVSSGPSKGRHEVFARKSCVRLRLDPWAAGKMNVMPPLKLAGEGKAAVHSALYLGYGPVKTAGTLKMEQPLDAGETAMLSMAFPDAVQGVELLDTAVRLAHALGTVGGRASNGWGSVSFDNAGQTVEEPAIREFSRDWESCLAGEWPHAVGIDAHGPLVWTTVERRPDWRAVIEDLARIRKQVNKSVDKRKREILNQPVAGKGKRMPSPLRFKVRRNADGRTQGVIYHMPHTPPPIAREDSAAIRAVWAGVHKLLDDHLKLPRMGS